MSIASSEHRHCTRLRHGDSTIVADEAITAHLLVHGGGDATDVVPAVDE